jgi:nitrogen regulatory protein PII
MNRKLVTVITEAALERDLIRELTSLGIGGYTFSEARGRGSHGSRTSSWEHSQNLRLEVLCDDARAQALMQRLREGYFDDYAMIAWSHDVDVLRPEKFP